MRRSIPDTAAISHSQYDINYAFEFGVIFKTDCRKSQSNVRFTLYFRWSICCWVCSENAKSNVRNYFRAFGKTENFINYDFHNHLWKLERINFCCCCWCSWKITWHSTSLVLVRVDDNEKLCVINDNNFQLV